MKLPSTITLYPSAYVDKNGVRIHPEPIVTDNLEVTFHINTSRKMVYATIDKVPNVIVLSTENDFDEINMITPLTLENTLLEKLGDDIQGYLQSLFPRTLEDDPNGPGTILSGMFSALGITASANCSCKRHAVEMNIKGNDWCEQNIDTIMSWLKEESHKRRLPFVETIARLIVQRAISKSRRLLSKNK